MYKNKEKDYKQPTASFENGTGVIRSTRDIRLYTIEEPMADRSTEEIMCGSSRLQSPGRCKKFHYPWKGPFIVMDKLGNTYYKIKPIHNGGRWQFVHDRNLAYERWRRWIYIRLHEEGAGERLQETLTTPPTVHAPAAEGNDSRSRSIGYDDILVSDDEDGAPVAGEQEPDEAIENQRRYPARNSHVTAHMSKRRAV